MAKHPLTARMRCNVGGTVNNQIIEKKKYPTVFLGEGSDVIYREFSRDDISGDARTHSIVLFLNIHIFIRANQFYIIEMM
jgi:hypothetical protein